MRPGLVLRAVENISAYMYIVSHHCKMKGDATNSTTFLFHSNLPTEIPNKFDVNYRDC